MRARVLAVSLCVLALAGAGLATGAQKPVRATFVSDSVAASILFAPSAKAALSRGIRLQLDLKVCRRLVETSCPYKGSRPSTALQAVERYGSSLGDVLIVSVGYNDPSAGYADGIDRVMRTAVAQGVDGVVWVTLRDARSAYRATNVAIRAAAKRWPQLVVADWDRHSRGKPWFRSDGLHLTPKGAVALASFLRPLVLRASKANPTGVPIG